MLIIKLRTIHNVIYRIVSTAIITLGLILLIVTLCGIRIYHVLTGSMGDLLPVGGACFVSTYASYEDVQVGDVIAFRWSNDMLVTHRAVAITEEGIITQGDVNNAPDEELVTVENFAGKTVFALPYVGAGLAPLKTPKEIAGIIICFTVLLIGGLLYKEKPRSATDENITENT